MNILGREQFIISQMVSQGIITDKTKSIFSTILSNSKAQLRYHPLIEEINPSYINIDSSVASQLLNSTVFMIPKTELSSDTIQDTPIIPFANTTMIYASPSEEGLR